VIQDVDEALRTIIRQEGLGGSDVEVALDAPTTDWAARRNSPTLDLYLYDICEDARMREHGLIDVRDEEGRVLRRDRPPRYFRLSYLVTAWTQRPEDEHRLLAAVLACMLRYDTMPADVLGGQLEGIRLPVPVTIAYPPPKDRSVSDIWTALGGELKPSLDLVVSAPFDLNRHEAFGPPVLEPVGLDVKRSDARESPALRPRRHRRAPVQEPPEPDWETVIGGSEELPGRTVRIRDLQREHRREPGEPDA